MKKRNYRVAKTTGLIASVGIIESAVLLSCVSVSAYSESPDMATKSFCDFENEFTNGLIDEELITNESIAKFNEYLLTVDQETAALILGDEQLVQSMQMTTYWDESNIEPDAAFSVTATTLPLPSWPSGSYFTFDGKECSCHKYCTYSKPDEVEASKYSRTRCFDTKEGKPGNCRRYVNTGAIQCKGFADYVFKQYNGVDCSNSNAVNESLATVDKENIKAYITSYLSVGAHLRGRLSNTTIDHSIIITQITDSGISYYHANYGKDCLVSTGTKNWEQLAEMFDWISIAWTR